MTSHQAETRAEARHEDGIGDDRREGMATPSQPRDASASGARAPAGDRHAAWAEAQHRAAHPEIEAVNPATGEVLEHLDQQAPEALAEALDAINNREAELKRWRAPIEAELRNRLKHRGRRLVVFGDWEVSNRPARKREWDADDLERVMGELVNSGIVRPAELTGIVSRVAQVSGSRALELRNRLTDDARAAVDQCWDWKEGRPKLTVARSVDLLAEGGQPATGTSTVVETPPGRGTAPPPRPSVPGPAGSPEPSTKLDPKELFA